MDFEKPEYQLWLNRIETDELYKELMSIVSLHIPLTSLRHRQQIGENQYFLH